MLKHAILQKLTKMYKKIGKRALEDSLATWIIATLAVFFVVFIYISIIYVMGGVKVAIGTSKDAVYSGKGDIALAEAFISFLNSPLDYNGQKILIKDLINGSVSDENKLLKFKELAENFMDKNVMLREASYQDTRRAWIRIYNSNEAISQSFNNQYSRYAVNRGQGYSSVGFTSVASKNCDASSGFLFYLILNDKKAAICSEY